MLVLVAMHLLATSGFQVIIPKTIRPNNLLSKNLNRHSRKTQTSDSVTSAITTILMATPVEEQAVAEFKMITEEESQLRKIGGVSIGIITIVLFFTQGQNYVNLSTGAFAALSTYRTGAEYQ